MDSPKNILPNETPYKPPTRLPSNHVSMLCASPTRCSDEYASTTSAVIHVPRCPRRGACAQARITEAKSWSTRISHASSRSTRLSVLRSDGATLNSAGRRTMRGSGLHHNTGWPSEYHGKMPRR
jgi:hypothetical protein